MNQVIPDGMAGLDEVILGHVPFFLNHNPITLSFLLKILSFSLGISAYVFRAQGFVSTIPPDGAPWQWVV